MRCCDFSTFPTLLRGNDLASHVLYSTKPSQRTRSRSQALYSQFGSLFSFALSGGFEPQSQGCSTDMGRGYSTSGCSVVTLGKELAQHVAVWWEKRNEKVRLLAYFGILWWYKNCGSSLLLLSLLFMKLKATSFIGYQVTVISLYHSSR